MICLERKKITLNDAFINLEKTPWVVNSGDKNYLTIMTIPCVIDEVLEEEGLAEVSYYDDFRDKFKYSYFHELSLIPVHLRNRGTPGVYFRALGDDFEEVYGIATELMPEEIFLNLIKPFLLEPRLRKKLNISEKGDIDWERLKELALKSYKSFEYIEDS